MGKEGKNGETTILTIISAVFAGLGLFFGMVFQTMAYWGPDGELSWTWFWTGVIAAYVCMILAILLMFINSKDRQLKLFDIFIRAVSFLVIVMSCLWTTFVTAMWMG